MPNRHSTSAKAVRLFLYPQHLPVRETRLMPTRLWTMPAACLFPFARLQAVPSLLRLLSKPLSARRPRLVPLLLLRPNLTRAKSRLRRRPRRIDTERPCTRHPSSRVSPRRRLPLGQIPKRLPLLGQLPIPSLDWDWDWICPRLRFDLPMEKLPITLPVRRDSAVLLARVRDMPWISLVLGLWETRPLMRV
jgi:hypothetical protein